MSTESLKRSAGDADMEAIEGDSQRPRSGSSDPKPFLADLPAGVVFFRVMNKRKNFFIPSTKNYFGGIKISELKCDSGCNSMLLPLTSVKEIYDKFSGLCDFEIKGGNCTAGGTLSLTVEYSAVDKDFEVKIATDLIGHPISLTYKTLRFALCGDDVLEILTSDLLKSLFSDGSISKLKSLDISLHKRRHHGLLGQALLSKMASLKYKGCELYVDVTVFQWPTTFAAFKAITEKVNVALSLNLPAGFDDWKDDDFEFEDDERNDSDY